MEVSARLDPAKKLRLLELTPELEKSLRDGSLVLKSNESAPNQVFLCTSETTHTVRRLKQSNSLLLSKPQSDALEVYASPFELLETIKTVGQVDWSHFPVYEGSRKHHHASSGTSVSTTPEWNCSKLEFEHLCREKPAVELDSIVHVIAPNITYDILVDVVSAAVEKGDLELRSDLTQLELQTQEPPIVVNAVFRKFSSENGLDIKRISAWVGCYLLQNCETGVHKTEFLKEWKLSLPIKLVTDLALLKGSAIEPRPGWIQYFDAQGLSTDPRRRFDDLFSIKQEWDLSEIEPFILPLMPASQKVENWILKYARRRKSGTQTIVSPIRRR